MTRSKKDLIIVAGCLVALLGAGTALWATDIRISAGEVPSNDRCDRALPVGEVLDLAFSTIKDSEDGQWVVLRCTNLLDRSVHGTWRLSGVREGVRARLDETPIEPLVVQDGRVDFVVPRRGIVTILVR